MPVTLYPGWHAISAHFAVGFTVGTSILVVVGLLARLLGYREFAAKLTAPLHAMLLLALVSFTLACATVLADFPAATLAASPWFRFKALVAVVAFFTYTGMYMLVALRRERVWENTLLLAYTTALALLGGFLVAVLGAAGGMLSSGHTVLKPVLAALGLPT